VDIVDSAAPIVVASLRDERLHRVERNWTQLSRKAENAFLATALEPVRSVPWKWPGF
jgi:hypothetical protein